MPGARDVDAAVGEERQHQRAHEVHHQRERRRQQDDQSARPGAVHERRRKEAAGKHARDETAHPAAGLLHADRGVGQLDNVAVAARRHAEEMQGGEDMLRNRQLQAQRQPRIRAGRDRGAQQPKAEGGQDGPVEGHHADLVGGQRDQARAEGQDPGGGQGKSHQRVRPADGGGVQARRGQADQRGDQRRAHERAAPLAGRQVAARAARTRLVQQEQKEHRHEVAVRQVRIARPLRPEHQRQRDHQECEQTQIEPYGEGQGMVVGGRHEARQPEPRRGGAARKRK